MALQSRSKIKKLWDGITPSNTGSNPIPEFIMMTEEESKEEKGFVQHRQSWRSDVFNRFINKLDSSQNQKTLAKPHELGEQVKRMPSICMKKCLSALLFKVLIVYHQWYH